VLSRRHQKLKGPVGKFVVRKLLDVSEKAQTGPWGRGKGGGHFAPLPEPASKGWGGPLRCDCACVLLRRRLDVTERIDVVGRVCRVASRAKPGRRSRGCVAAASRVRIDSSRLLLQAAMMIFVFTCEATPGDFFLIPATSFYACVCGLILSGFFLGYQKFSDGYMEYQAKSRVSKIPGGPCGVE